MAIYHLHVGIIKRSSGRSAVAAAAYRAADKLHSEHDDITYDYSQKSSVVNAAAYRAGESLKNEHSGATHDYTYKTGVVHTEIMLPENAPQEYSGRSTLWNAVEKAERRKDAQTAREIDIALPVELERSEQITLVREYVKENFVDVDMCADFAIHDKGDGNVNEYERSSYSSSTRLQSNPHAHIMLTTREVSAGGFGGKNREWNKTEYLKEWRENWADCCNKRLQSKEIDKCIDHRTLKAQGIDREPTIHIGVAGKYMEYRGIEHSRTQVSREIITQNESIQLHDIAKHMHALKESYIILDREISSLQEETAEARREMNFCRVKAEEITERAEQIHAMGKRLEELRTGGQQQARQQTQQLERSHEQATSYFRQTYNFVPEEAPTEVKRLESRAESKKHLQDKLQEKLTPLIEEKEVFLFEYQRHKLLAQISPDSQSIQDKLSQLDKEVMNGLSTQDRLAYMRCGRVLDVVPDWSFQRILDELHPEQAYKLIKLRERERAREHERGRYR